MLRPSPLIISLTVVALLGVTPARAAGGGIARRNWSETAFAQAKGEKPFVLLDLGAVWCHWYHVMERGAYGNPPGTSLPTGGRSSSAAGLRAGRPHDRRARAHPF